MLAKEIKSEIPIEIINRSLARSKKAHEKVNCK